MTLNGGYLCVEPVELSILLSQVQMRPSAPKSVIKIANIAYKDSSRNDLSRSSQVSKYDKLGR